jgi:hypothetical protein
VVHFRAGCGCVQSIRSATTGAGHERQTLPRGTANGSGTACTSVSAETCSSWAARGLEVGHFRAALGCVQSVRSAAPGARHGHQTLPRGTANGSGTACTSVSAVSAPRVQGPAPPKCRGLFGGARLPPGRPAPPPLRDHGAKQARIGCGSDLRGSKAPGNVRAPAGGGSRRLAENLKAGSTGRSAGAPLLRGLVVTGCSPWTLTMGLGCWLGPPRRGEGGAGPRPSFGAPRRKSEEKKSSTFGFRLESNYKTGPSPLPSPIHPCCHRWTRGSQLHPHTPGGQHCHPTAHTPTT